MSLAPQLGVSKHVQGLMFRSQLVLENQPDFTISKALTYIHQVFLNFDSLIKLETSVEVKVNMYSTLNKIKQQYKMGS